MAPQAPGPWRPELEKMAKSEKGLNFMTQGPLALALVVQAVLDLDDRLRMLMSNLSKRER